MGRFLSPELRSRLIEAYTFHAPVGLKRLTSAKIGLPLRRELLQKRIMFIHIPKNAGTTISTQLYGGHIGHRSARFYQACDPVFFAEVPRFAIYRDPVLRFVSAYNFARKGGSKTVPASESARRFATRFETPQDCARHISDIGPVMRDKLDPVFRSQAHYVCDEAGRLLVSDLFDLTAMSNKTFSYAGFAFDMRLRVNNKTNSGPMTKDDAILKSLVLAAYPEDFELESCIQCPP